jgi:hypothetical protein
MNKATERRMTDNMIDNMIDLASISVGDILGVSYAEGLDSVCIVRHVGEEEIVVDVVNGIHTYRFDARTGHFPQQHALQEGKLRITFAGKLPDNLDAEVRRVHDAMQNLDRPASSGKRGDFRGAFIEMGGEQVFDSVMLYMLINAPGTRADEYVDADVSLVTEHLHWDGAHRGSLPNNVFSELYVMADGFGQHDAETLATINGGYDWSHIRDSTPEAYTRMADHLRSLGFGVEGPAPASIPTPKP